MNVVKGGKPISLSELKSIIKNLCKAERRSRVIAFGYPARFLPMTVCMPPYACME